MKVALITKLLYTLAIEALKLLVDRQDNKISKYDVGLIISQYKK